MAFPVFEERHNKAWASPLIVRQLGRLMEVICGTRRWASFKPSGPKTCQRGEIPVKIRFDGDAPSLWGVITTWLFSAGQTRLEPPVSAEFTCDVAGSELTVTTCAGEWTLITRLSRNGFITLGRVQWWERASSCELMSQCVAKGQKIRDH